MAGPYQLRRGWDREKLAEYILSRVCFVAKPSTVSDDLGSDFFCTLFRLEEKDGRDYPLPLSSFAIQIKSNDDPFDFSANITYLKDLEIPFFWGVLNESTKRLSVFSGENLPIFFPHVGQVRKLKIKPLERSQMSKPYDLKEGSQDNYTVMFPMILNIDIDSTREVLNRNVATLQEMCSLIHRNISTRKTEEYIFDGYDGKSVTILAGPGSVKQYRNNFMKRLAENFYNLKWSYDKCPNGKKHTAKKEIIEEFKIYEDIYVKIRNVYRDIPPYLNKIYEELKNILFYGENA